MTRWVISCGHLERFYLNVSKVWPP